MVRRMLLITLAAAALVGPATALAGGWATVGLSSLPDGTRPGGTWTVDLTVQQHGVRPMTGLAPAVTVRGPGGGEAVFPARPTGRPGVYRAQVRFPTVGRFSYVVDDGFTATHRFAPVTIAGRPVAAAGAADPGDSPPWTALGAALAAGLLAAFGARAVGRRPRAPALRRRAPAA